MIKLSKRSTIYFDPQVHKILKYKAIESSRSVSEIVHDAILHELAEDKEDLEAFSKRAHEPTVSFEALLKELKLDGKI
ncbi:MAG: CopG family transcriptional regulator [Candidatus Omnitrophota bacterium]